MDLTPIKTEARRLLHFDQPAQAIALLQDGMARMGADAEAHGLMGAALSRTGNDPAAVSHFEQAVRLDPFKAPNHFNLGVAYEKMGRPDWALEGYRQALVRDPQFEQAITAYYRLAPQIASRPAPEEETGPGSGLPLNQPSAADGLPAPPVTAAPAFEGPREWNRAPQAVRSAYFINVAFGVLSALFFVIFVLIVMSGTVSVRQDVEMNVYMILCGVAAVIQVLMAGAHRRAWKPAWAAQLILAVLGLLGFPIGTLIYALLLTRWFSPEVKAWYGVS